MKNVLLFVAEEYLLEDPKNYRFLSNGNLTVAGLNDANEYECTKVWQLQVQVLVNISTCILNRNRTL